jgi:NADPH-ferrihemoprotein reductase
LLTHSQNLDCIVFWGSQSGRGEALAKRLVKGLSSRFGWKTLAADLDDFDLEHLTELQEKHICGFVLSTYGDGDPSDNASGLWRLLHRSKDELQFHRLRYFVFGLGNSDYRQYNRVAKIVDAAFSRLGAQRFGELGAGDDSQGKTEDGFLAWKSGLETELKEQLGLAERPQRYQPSLRVEEVQTPEEVVFDGEPHRALLDQETARPTKLDPVVPSVLSIDSVRCLSDTAERICLQLEIDLGADRRVKYKTGDHLAIWPSNPDLEVTRLLSVLALSEKRRAAVNITSVDNEPTAKVPVPTLTTIEALFSNYLEICGPLSREIVQGLSEYAPTQLARRELDRICGDAATFRSEVLEPRLTLSGLLAHISSDETWSVPSSFLVEGLKPMQPRYYSISSAAAVSPSRASITVAINKPTQTLAASDKMQGQCFGLATSYLRSIAVSINRKTGDEQLFALHAPGRILSGHKVFARVRQSTFKLPMKASSLIIMVGCGTGVAPFRAFLQERVRRKNLGEEVGKTLLFMGFRRRLEDFLYAEEWQTHQQVLGEDILKIWIAFSRDDPARKVYVQDRLLEHAGELIGLFESSSSCRMFVCGGAAMARDVGNALARAKSLVSAMSDEGAIAWVKWLRQSKQLLEDVW